MREIKFRVWEKNELSMAKVISIDFDEEIVQIDLHSGMWGAHFNQVVLMQFTGLTDRNGVEIYEGDIVSIWIEYGEPPTVVHVGEVLSETRQWRKDGGSGYLGAWVVSGYDSGDYYDPCLVNWEVVEVLGNIYENPELLTQ